jgi:hypothetical protein
MLGVLWGLLAFMPRHAFSSRLWPCPIEKGRQLNSLMPVALLDQKKASSRLVLMRTGTATRDDRHSCQAGVVVVWSLCLNARQSGLELTRGVRS